METLQELLIEFEACRSAREWVGDRTIEEAVAECPIGDWMLWLAQRLNFDIVVLTLVKGHCANTVRHLMTDERSIKAVDAAIAYGEGRIREKELKKAAATASYADAHAASAASYADAHAASAASDAAYYADNKSRAAIIENQKQTADICRKYIGQLIIDKVNAL